MTHFFLLVAIALYRLFLFFSCRFNFRSMHTFSKYYRRHAYFAKIYSCEILLGNFQPYSSINSPKSNKIEQNILKFCVCCLEQRFVKHSTAISYEIPYLTSHKSLTHVYFKKKKLEDFLKLIKWWFVYDRNENDKNETTKLFKNNNNNNNFLK